MSPDRSVTVFAPATIGNVICGFDVFGLALETPGDRVTVRASDRSGLHIRTIEGDAGRLPTDPARNSATVAIAAVLRKAEREDGIEVTIEKGLPLSGGMGGSAASSVAGAVAADRLLGTGFSSEDLLACALEGEMVAAGSVHLDNVAPALLGGLLLVRHDSAFPIVRLPVLDGLTVALLHPDVELSTKAGREAVGTTVSLTDAVSQWGNTAAFVHALHTTDWELLADALQDRIAEPHRSAFIPGFREVCRAAVEAGAVACGISGAGPSIVSFCRGEESAGEVGQAMLASYRATAGPPAQLHLSAVSREGARVLTPSEASAE